MPADRRRDRSGVRRLAAARLISCTGGFAAYTALFFAVYQKTHSPVWVSVALIATVAVGGIVGPLAGALADRLNRRSMMLASDMAAAVAYMLLVPDHGVLLLVGLAALATIFEAPFLPASSAAIPALADETDLTWANSLVATGMNIGKTLGPVLAGGLIAVGGPGLVFAANAASFLASVALVWTVRGNFRAEDAPTNRKGQVREGFRFLSGERVLSLCALSEVSAWMFTTLAMVSETALAAHYRSGSIGYGSLVAGWGVGMVAGSMAAGRRLRPDTELSGFLNGRVVMAAGLGLVCVCSALMPVVGLLALGGAGSGYLMVARQSLYQRRIPDRLRARVFAAVDAIGTAFFAVGVLIAGVLVALWGVHAAYLIAGLGVGLGCLPVLAARQRLTRETAARAQLIPEGHC